MGSDYTAASSKPWARSHGSGKAFLAQPFPRGSLFLADILTLATHHENGVQGLLGQKAVEIAGQYEFVRLSGKIKTAAWNGKYHAESAFP